MEGQLIDVEYEDGYIEIARIIEDTPGHFVVTPLVPTLNGLVKFSNQYHVIPKESIAGFYDTERLEDTGLFKKIDDNLYEAVDTSDSEYEYFSDEESDTDSEVSLDSE